MPEDRKQLRAINPRTGQSDYSFTQPTPEEIDAICSRLRVSQKRWGAATLEERTEVLLAWADEIERNAKQIGDAEYADTGRYRISHEVPLRVAGSIRVWSQRIPGILKTAAFSGTSSVRETVSYETQLKPYALVGVISPWNHPFLLSTIDAIPALFAGCAVIIKPSELTPRFVEPVMETVSAVPTLRDILYFVQGDSDVGARIIQNADAQCFTGSIATGRKIAEQCARRFIPAFLELGGKDAAIVTASADLERAATAITRGSVYGTGQICFGIERVYVHESVHDKLVELLVKKAEELELAYPDPRQGDMNPFISPHQASIVDAHLDDAVAKGAKILCGGKSQLLDGGRYMRPTVLTHVAHSMKVMTDETFGPVTPVMSFKTEDEALRLANDTEFGLSGAIIAGNLEEAKRLARELDAGAISLQDAALTESIMQDVEKNSFNKSGMGGSRMGPNSVLRFFRKKALIHNSGPSTSIKALGEGQATAR